MTDETRDKVRSIFLKVFDTINEESFDFPKKADQYENWDSFAHMQLISEAEGTFSLSFEIEEISQIDSAEKLVEFIITKK